jgi:polysaccharide export outer membrane protein
MGRYCLVLSLAVALAGCGGSTFQGARLSSGPSAYGVISADAAQVGTEEYRIGKLDHINVVVFQEPDLSLNNAEVNAAGKISLPLIGDVVAEGKTGPELAGLIGQLYGRNILENPQISVSIAESVSQKVVVQGEVTEPGVYEIKGPTTLLQALSMAKGETRIAKTQEVAVFRVIDGVRNGALFDVRAIRRGEAQDPIVQGNDTIIVGLSQSKSAWRDVLATAPLLAVFRPLAY